MHGMPVSFLLGLVKNSSTLPGFSWFTPCLQPSEIVYIGLRDLDDQEKFFIKDLKIKAFTVCSCVLQVIYCLDFSFC